MNHTGLRTSQEKWNPYGKVFLLCLLTGCLIFVPYIVMGGGIFTIRADFIYQQIPFNMMANEAVKTGMSSGTGIRIWAARLSGTASTIWGALSSG